MSENFIRDRITQLRINANISEYQLSFDLGHSKGYIQGITSGKSKPSLPALIEICNYFNITLQEFFDEETHYPELMHRINVKLKLLGSDELELFDQLLEKYTSKS